MSGIDVCRTEPSRIRRNTEKNMAPWSNPLPPLRERGLIVLLVLQHLERPDQIKFPRGARRQKAIYDNTTLETGACCFKGHCVRFVPYVVVSLRESGSETTYATADFKKRSRIGHTAEELFNQAVAKPCVW
jgi:hypothetical protein